MSIEDTADDATRKAKDLADDASDKAKDLADDASDKAKDVADKVGDKTDEARRTASRVADDVTDKAKQTADQVSGKVQDAVDEVQEGHGVVNRLHRLGFKSEYAYVGGFASIGLSLATWYISRNKTGDDKGQSDRWGIFIGHWAPTFMALGVALKLEEKR